MDIGVVIVTSAAISIIAPIILGRQLLLRSGLSQTRALVSSLWMGFFAFFIILSVTAIFWLILGLPNWVLIILFPLSVVIFFTILVRYNRDKNLSSAAATYGMTDRSKHTTQIKPSATNFVLGIGMIVFGIIIIYGAIIDRAPVIFLLGALPVYFGAKQSLSISKYYSSKKHSNQYASNTTSSKNPEKPYAAELLEEEARLNPSSASVHFSLGAEYSRIANEYGNDEESIRPWAKKSRDSFKKAVDLALSSGGLNEKQIAIAQGAVNTFDRIMERDSPSIPEDQRKKIFADFMETHDTEFLLGSNLLPELRKSAPGLGDMMQSIKRSGQQADATTYAIIAQKYELTEGQLRAIIEEGEQKKWPFKAVAR